MNLHLLFNTFRFTVFVHGRDGLFRLMDVRDRCLRRSFAFRVLWNLSLRPLLCLWLPLFFPLHFLLAL